MSGLKIIKNSSFKDNREFYWTILKKWPIKKTILSKRDKTLNHL